MNDYFGKDFSALKYKRLWLFDMDGTIYLGDKIFDGTLDLLENIVKAGGKYVFVTNNSSKGKTDYVKKVRSMGIKADENNFYTSIDAAASLLKEKFKNELIYAQGTKSFIKNLKAEGLNVTTKYNDKSRCVIVAFDTELTADKLSNTCKSLLKNVPYYATNPDWVCPTEFGYIPDCGSMCLGIEKATGKTPVFIGKPSPLMIDEVIKKFGVDKKDVIIVGDRLYTDIASGVSAGVETVLVLSGESTVKDIENSEIKPFFTISDVKNINKIFQ